MDSQHLRVPYGLLRQLCYGGGNRLMPLVDKTRPEEGDVEAVSLVWTPTGGYTSTPVTGEIVMPGMHIVNPSSVTQTTVSDRPLWPNGGLGNLSNEMYRYFLGSPDNKSLFFTCRGCLTQEKGHESASKHFDHCRQLMSAIEERIRRDRICVICNKGTTTACWRIPLCSTACVTKWRFTIPASWMVARRFVLAAEPKLLAFNARGEART